MMKNKFNVIPLFTSLNMNIVEVSQLARDRGYTLKTLPTEDTSLYWLENTHFIGKPFKCLEDLVNFMYKLPVIQHLNAQLQ